MRRFVELHTLPDENYVVIHYKRIMLDLEKVTAIVEDGDSRSYIFSDGAKHRVHHSYKKLCKLWADYIEDV
jgi:hypothetical protein